MALLALRGGAQAALTTTETIVDLSAFAGRTVHLYCAEGDIWFCASPDSTAQTLVTAGAQAASATALVADRAAQGAKVPREINPAEPYLVVKMVTGTGTLKVKCINKKGLTTAPAESATGAPVSGTIGGAVTVTQGSPTKTTNATYQTATSLGADVLGAAITVGPEGRLEVSAKWTAASTQIGTLLLQTLSLIDGTTWVDIPGSSGGFGQHPNNDSAETLGVFRELQPFTSVRLKYARTSGGAAGNNFTAATRVM
jgi:hypothetical protein